MKIVATTVFRGPNRYHKRPVVHLRLHVAADSDLRTDIPITAFVETLESWLPGIADRRQEVEANGTGNVAIDWLPFVALALQNLSGSHLQIGWVLGSASKSEFEAVYEYESMSLGRYVARRSAELVRDVARTVSRSVGEISDNHSGAPGVDVFRIARRRSLDASTRGLVHAAEARDIPWYRLSDDARYVQLGYGRHAQRIFETMTSTQSNVIGIRLARNKALTVDLLRQSGVPVPRQRRASTLQRALTVAESIGYPVVSKPRLTSFGRGVTVDIRDADQLRAAYERAREASKTVILEEFIRGDDHRILVANGKLIAAAKRIPAHVVGDGVSTIEELVAAVNRSPLRKTGFGRHLRRIELDHTSIALLELSGYSARTIPACGETVYLRRTANLSTGGTSVDVTDVIHPDNVAIAVRAAEVIGLGVAGVDFITPDVSRSCHEVGGAICEVNGCPGLGPHWLAEGPPRDVAGALIESLFPPDRPSRIPIVGICGSPPLPITCQLLTHILKQRWDCVGLASSDGVFVDGELLIRGDGSDFRGARAVLSHARVEVAVIETDAQRLLCEGLGYDACEVAVVTNVVPGPKRASTDGARGSDTFRPERVLIELARRAIVLNADDPGCLKLGERAAAQHTWLFSTNPDNVVVREHIDRGGRAAILFAQTSQTKIGLYFSTGEQRRPSMMELPNSFDDLGDESKQCVLIATAIGHAMGSSLGDVQQAVASYLL